MQYWLQGTPGDEHPAQSSLHNPAVRFGRSLARTAVSVLAPDPVSALPGQAGRGAVLLGVGHLPWHRPCTGAILPPAPGWLCRCAVAPERGAREMGDGKDLCFSPEFLRVSCLVSQAGDLILQVC